MSPSHERGPRFAAWWARALTSTAPAQAGLDRREEIASDVHEQLAARAGEGVSSRRVSREVLSRALRGMPSDLLWRLSLEAKAERVRWHLSNPSSVITALFVLLLPVNLLADAAGNRSPALLSWFTPLWFVTLVLAAALLGFAVVALVQRPREDQRESLPRLGGAVRARRVASAAMGITWALSALGRYSAWSPMQALATAAWVLFGLSLASYGLLVVGCSVRRLLTLGR